jgi:hypothetical protein
LVDPGKSDRRSCSFLNNDRYNFELFAELTIVIFANNQLVTTTGGFMSLPLAQEVCRDIRKLGIPMIKAVKKGYGQKR